MLSHRLFEAQVAVAAHQDYIELLDGDDGHPMPGTPRGWGRGHTGTTHTDLSKGNLFVSCRPLPGWPYVQSGKRFLASPILVDIDEDGTEEVLVASKTAELMFFTYASHDALV